ncbi:hypothetical protein J2S89_000870 [Arthrobacter bambusae]|nr:hypothetical protein [Arthrobacter bambusae]MDQ0098545.1 hypothetical protein [Arthrobacter bambusae]
MSRGEDISRFGQFLGNSIRIALAATGSMSHMPIHSGSVNWPMVCTVSPSKSARLPSLWIR